MKPKVQEKEYELKRRPHLSVQLGTVLELGKQLRNEILESARDLEEGEEDLTVIHLDNALGRLNDMNFEVIDAMNWIELFSIEGPSPTNRTEKTADKKN